MTIRTKIWLLVAVSVALTVGIAAVLRQYVMRHQLVAEAQGAAEELAKDIVDDLEAIEGDADDRELAQKLDGYLRRHSRIQRLDLYVEREGEATAASSRITAGRERRPEIERLAAFHREPHQMVARQDTGESIPPIEKSVDLKGPWKATLVMRWSLGPVQTMLRTERRYSLVFGAGVLIALALLSGVIADRVVGRPLEGLARAMRDVEGGDLARRVLVEGDDEVGRLASGFNRMLERLGQADTEIRAFNQRLADEIRDATADLKEKNATLGQLNRLLNDMRRDNASKVRLATLGQLAAQLAHEIGTPLSSVSGHLQLALLQRDLLPALRERLEVGSREIERISRIVRDYLDSTRPLEPERKPTDVGRLIEEAIEVAGGERGGRRGRVQSEVASGLGEIVTDPGLLRQIVVNLVSNALDAIDERGGVAVSAEVEGADIVLAVRDTGAGIAPDDLRRIFEPFYTTKGRGKGTGLGLAICRQLTAALGGTISVESRPGEGSTFTVRLPRAGAPPARAPGTSGEFRAATGARA